MAPIATARLGQPIIAVTLHTVCVCVCVLCLLVELLMPTPKLAASPHPQHPAWSLVRGECLGKTC